MQLTKDTTAKAVNNIQVASSPLFVLFVSFQTIPVATAIIRNIMVANTRDKNILY